MSTLRVGRLTIPRTNRALGLMLPRRLGLTTMTSDASSPIITLGLRPKGSVSGVIEGLRIARLEWLMLGVL